MKSPLRGMMLLKTETPVFVYLTNGDKALVALKEHHDKDLIKESDRFWVNIEFLVEIQ